MKLEKISVNYGYQKNEWIVMYSDDGVKVKLFDTKGEAQNFLNACYCGIGVITTSFYNNVICN